MSVENDTKTLKHQVEQAMKNIIFAMIALMLAPSLAMAGESNSKDDPILKVKNPNDVTALVVIGDFNEEMAEAEDLEDFEDAGGIVLGPGQTSEGVEVKAGNHTVSWFFIFDEDLPEDEDDFASTSVRVREGRDRTFRLPIVD